MRVSVQASPPQHEPSTSSGTFGRPVSSSSARNAPATIKRPRLGKHLPDHLVAQSFLVAGTGDDQARASETMNAGSWLTSPSPIVSLV